MALEFVGNKNMSASAIQQMLQERGFLVGCYPAANIIRFDPALTISKHEIDRTLDCLDMILK
ncbi:hypothetical protein A3746_15655 [Oleibacter sp. HI0075]|nr:hypothetical protein A3746_32865 [Oleibacter sp. HI0075]KZZ09352.1 hypothetical protein A3746_15655 [Oleibacter sp. HI0075]